MKQQKKKRQTAALKHLHTVGARIRYYRESRGMEQKEIAAQLGITPNAVSNWENGRTRPDLSLLPPLCEILNITLYELYGIDKPVDRYSDREQLLVAGYRALSDGHRAAVEQMIDSLKSAEAAARCPALTVLTACSRQLAAGLDANTDFEAEGEPVYLYSSPLIRQADLVFPVSGNSMEPVYHDGDLVLVQRAPECPALHYGEIGAFLIGSSTYIKVYAEDGLRSLNRQYKTMKFAEDERVTLIGRVLGILEPDDFAKPEDIRLYQQIHAGEV